MEEGLKNEVLRLINLTSTNKYDVNSMINIIRNNFDPTFSVCVHCVAQIKFAQTQLLNWYNSVNVEQPIIAPEPPPSTGCQKCKKKGSVKK